MNDAFVNATFVIELKDEYKISQLQTKNTILAAVHPNNLPKFHVEQISKFGKDTNRFV